MTLKPKPDLPVVREAAVAIPEGETGVEPMIRADRARLRYVMNHMVLDNHMKHTYTVCMLKFYATVEFLSGQRAAILTLTNEAGEWAGSGRIEVRSGLQSDLYEEAYRQASFNAQSKGGRLERLSVVRESCGARAQPQLERRPGNALNVEIGQPAARCLNKRPAHWPAGASSLRWIASGGDSLVFGACGGACPLEHQS